MAKKVYDEKIDKNTDWGGDASTGDLPVAGARVQEFLKEQLNGRIGHLHYDETNNRYIAFADEDTKNEYLDDVTKTDLILGTFDAPFNYTASIDLLSPSYVSILNGTKNNYIDFTFDIVNKQGASTGEPVIVTYTFIKSGKKQTVTEQYQPGTQVHFKVDDYISTGTNYVQVAITGQNTLAATTRSVTYLVVDLQLTDDLSISKVYSPDSSMVAEIPYSVSGYGTKVMEWYVDGVLLDFVKVEDEILDISTTRTKYIDLSELSHGRHSIQFRTYVVIDGDNFYSDTLYRDVIVNRGLSTDPIIAIATVIPTGYPLITTGNVVLYGMTQYVPYTISFAVYAPGNTSSVLTQVYLDGSTIANIDAQNGRVNTLGLRVSSYGNKVLQLKAGDTTYDVTASIARSTISIEEINSGLTLALQAIGRSNADTNKDEWVYGLINTTFTGFEWNGQSGWNNSRLLINKGAYIDMNVAPFASDVTNTGATFEFEFETSNVTDDDAAICDLRGGTGAGILITASEAKLVSSNGNEVSTRFKSGETLRVAFVINRRSGVVNKGLVFVYVNGINSGAVNYTAVDDFLSSKSLRIGNTQGATIALKDVRFYANALTSDQILNNYMLYRDTVDDMFGIYDDNNIYEAGSTVFSLEAIAAKCPVVVFTGNIPELEATSNKNHEITVDVEYINLQNRALSFTAKGARMRPQGTSSMGYPKKNFRLYTKYGTMYDYQGNVVEGGKYSFKPGAQPVAVWCFKADYAESSGTHNTGVARLWNDVLRNTDFKNGALKTEAQKTAIANNYPYDVRTTVDGFPVVLLYRLTADSDLVFIGKYNFNNDKSTESVFGFCDIPGYDNSKTQCWEVLNNGDEIANFQTADNFNSKWEDAFEARYPDKSKNIGDLKELCEWLVSTRTNPTGGFGEYLTIRSEVMSDNSLQYGSNSPYVEAGDYVDNAANRLRKFQREKWDYLDVYKMAAGYVYRMRFGAVDQMVKNKMWETEGTQGVGTHCKWFEILYDNDTINALINNGYLRAPWYLTRQTLDDSYTADVYYYAGHDSTLWNNLEADEEFMRICCDVDNAMFTAGLSYNNVINMFDVKQAASWCARIYNQDAQYKYIGPYTDSGINNLFMLQGSRELHRKWWLSKRFDLMDSKFVSGDYKSKAIEFKVAAAPTGIKFSITAGSKLFYGYGINNIAIESGHELDIDDDHEFTTKQILNIGDPVRIYGARSLKELDLSNFSPYMSNLNIAEVLSDVTGTCLEKLVLGHDALENASFGAISGLTNATKLKYLGIRNMKGFTSLDLSAQTEFEELRASGSGLLGLVLPDGAPVKVLELPDTMAAIQFINFPSLETLIIENGGTKIRTIEIRNCPLIDSKSFIFDWLDNKVADSQLCSVNVEGIDWQLTQTEMAVLVTFKSDGGIFNGVGAIHLAGSVWDTEIEEFNTLFSNITFTCDTLLVTPVRTIKVVDANGAAMEGVSVSFMNKTFVTDSQGEISIRSVSGGSCIISKSNYYTQEVTLTTIEEDTVNTITLVKIPIRTFIVKDDNSNLLEGVTMEWNGNSYTTGADGKISIMSGEGGTYVFSKEGYTSSSQSLDAITVDSTHSIVLPKIYTITFNIKDTNGIALKNVSVTVGTTTKAADASGVVSFVVSKGTYAYSAVYYDSTKTGSVSVTVSDVVTNISFERDVADSQPVLNGNIQIVIIATSTTFKFKVTSSVADYVIDWGDGETSTATATGTTEYTHVYDEVGYYDIEISNCSNVTMAIPTTIANVVAYWSIGNSNINGLSFYSASKLKTIGSDIFKNDATRISFDSCFDSCPKFTIIPEGLFDSCTAVTNFSSLFRRCSNLTSIPEGLFDKCTAVTDLSWCFGSCFNLTSIPEGLFDKCTSVTSFSACFNSCSNLTSIPEGLFDKCTSVTSFGGAFDSCYNLTSIPEGLFDSCTAATDFSIIFRYCSNLTSIPEGLFDSCTAVTNLSWCFADCTKLTNGIVPNVDTTPNINNMYYNCTVIDFVKVKREIPLSFSNTITGNSTFKVYVPDASVDAYKAASGWSAFATRIFPMSQFSTDFPNG